MIKPSSLSAGFLGLTQVFVRWRPKLWGWLYNQIAARDKSGALLFMNYGYAETSDENVRLELYAEDELFRYPIQLYAHVIQGIDIKDKDVLEVGSGRGGGGSFVLRYYDVRSFVGVDVSRSAIAWCRQKLTDVRARWLQGRADALPLFDSSRDVVINVESSHCYPSMEHFLKEVYRVLRPGGYFTFCDMRTQEGVVQLKNSFNHSGLKIVEWRDITQNVLNALGQLSDDREQTLIPGVPRFLRAAFRDFIALKGTSLYSMFNSGDMVYLSVLLQKSDV